MSRVESERSRGTFGQNAAMALTHEGANGSNGATGDAGSGGRNNANAMVAYQGGQAGGGAPGGGINLDGTRNSNRQNK